MNDEKSQVLILDNYYEIIEIPKTKTKIFKDLKIGDIVHIELDMKTERSYRGIYALYPRVNGQVSSGVSIINDLLHRGMRLRKLSFKEIEEYQKNREEDM